jgi:multidrug resistance protein
VRFPARSCVIAESTSKAASKTALATLFGVVIVDLIGFGIVMPILPFWAREHGVSATGLGAIASAYAAAQFVCAPLWGRLSDRIGRRPVLLLTIAGTTAALALLAAANSVAVLFAARILGGAFAANFSVASAYLSDVTPPEQRTGRMALLGACFAIGFTLGPILGGVLAPYGEHVPLAFAAGLSALNLAFAFARLPEPTRSGDAAAAEVVAPEVVSGPRFAAFGDPVVRAISLANLAFSLAVTQLESMFAYLMADAFGYDARGVAFVLVGMALVMGTVQGGMRRIAPRFGEARLVIAGVVLMALAFAAIPHAPSVGVLLAPLVLSAIGRGIAQPSMMGLASLAATPTTRGAVMGTFQSMASLARVFGPFAAGWLYDQQRALPFWLAAALVLLALATPWRRIEARVRATAA